MSNELKFKNPEFVMGKFKDGKLQKTCKVFGNKEVYIIVKKDE